MAFKFKEKLSDELRIQIDETNDEMKRLFSLSDRFLGRAILMMARKARSDDPDRLGIPESGYENLLVWSVIPALAIRLGETSLTADERVCLSPIPYNNDELREYVGVCMSNCSFIQTVASSTLHQLNNTFVNGNPITIALDRIAPPRPDSNDWVVRHTREISRARFGDERFSSWSPEMQEYSRNYDDITSAGEAVPELTEDSCGPGL